MLGMSCLLTFTCITHFLKVALMLSLYLEVAKVINKMMF